MKHLFLISSIIISTSVQAQFSDSLLKKQRRFQLGVNFSPDYCYRTLEKQYGDQNTDNIIEARNKIEEAKFGYTTGINACFNFNRHIGIELGAQYSNKGYQLNLEDITFSQQPSSPPPSSVDYTCNFHYVDIPVKVNVSFGKKKLRFISSLGLTTNVFIKEIDKSVVYYPDHTDKNSVSPGYDYKKVNLSAALSAGVSYSLTNRMSLRIEPNVRYGLTHIIDAPITATFYSVGMNVGYYIAF